MFGKNKNFESSVDNIIFFLIVIYPWLLMTGPFVPDSITIIFSIYFIFSCKNLNFFLKNNIIIFLLLLFYIYLVFNSFFSSHIWFSLKSTLPYLRFIPFLIVLVLSLEKNEKKFKYLFYSYILLILILFIDSCFQKIVGYNFFGQPLIHPNRVSSFFGTELIMGGFVLKIFMLSIALLFFINIKNKLIFIILLSIISIITILLSGEKSAFGLYLLFISISFVFFPINVKFKIFSYLLILFTIIAIIFSNSSVKTRIIDQGLNNSQFGKYIFSQVHDSHYRSAYKMFLDKPFIGQGANTFRKECSKIKFLENEFSCSTHPHNIYIQSLAEVGSIGFLFLFMFFLFINFIIIKSYYQFIYLKKNNLSLIFFSLPLFVVFFPITPTGNFFNNYNSCFYFFLFSFFLWAFRKYENYE